MKLSIRTKLFIGYTLLCTVLVLTSSYLYYSDTSKTLISNIEKNNEQQLYYYQEALDSLVEDLDRITAQIIYSSAIKNYLMNRTEEGDSSYQAFAERKTYEDMLANFNGPWFIAQQINLIGLDGFFLTYGNSMSIPSDIKQRVSSTRWMNDVLIHEGDKVLIPPRVSEWQDKDTLYFSLARSFNLTSAFSPALVEVQQSYERIAKIFADLGEQQVYVVNEQSQLFFPVSLTNPVLPNIPQWTEGLMEVQNGKQTELWSKRKSDFTELTIYIKQDKAQVLLPIAKLKQLTWTLAIFGEVLSLIIAYVLSHTLTAPIRYLQKRLQNLDVANILPQPSKKLKNTKEISSLYNTFEDMTKRLNQSINETLEANQRESVAHLHAMYAQMNPHFLYNTLTAMASYAEESGFNEYATLSKNLSSMLRYSTNYQAQNITLKTELEYTLQYTELMKFRYENQFKLIVHVDESLDELIVPKFLLQPLVENSFTHGFQNSRPPWMIELTVVSLKDESYWMIRIRDNGTGFNEQAFQETQALINELNNGVTRKLQDISSHGLGNLGIVNTLTRCRLFWNDNVRFSLRNADPGAELTLEIRKEN